MKLFKTILFLISLQILTTYGLIHDLKIRNDDRNSFFIENFGFNVGGVLDMTIIDFTYGGEPVTDDKLAGFIIKRTETDSTVIIEENRKDSCIFDNPPPTDVKVEFRDGKFNLTVEPDEGGFYNIYFVNCGKETVSFELKLVQYNVDANGRKNYLSAGYIPLPTVYGVFTILYVACLIIWVFNFVRSTGAKINRVHHLMTVFIILKMCSLLFKTIELAQISKNGSAVGWNIVYYIFTGLRGITLFVLIALIGTGWSFVKPFLSDKDKKIFLIVIPLQIIDNIALIFVEETAPGSQGWFTMKDIFRLIDIICCGAILIPIIWSIKHLREASQIDGKAARNMKKLKLFRQFYLMVISYIYFTRIIVYLVDATLPYQWVWLGDLFAELATIVFFTVTGYKFRPASDNPYFALELEDAGQPINNGASSEL